MADRDDQPANLWDRNEWPSEALTASAGVSVYPTPIERQTAKRGLSQALSTLRAHEPPAPKRTRPRDDRQRRTG